MRQDIEENIWFIDYLELGYELLKDANEYRGGHIDINSHIISHQTSIQEAIIKYKDNDRVYKKYLWLAKYHNQFCTDHKFNDFLIQY